MYRLVTKRRGACYALSFRVRWLPVLLCESILLLLRTWRFLGFRLSLSFALLCDGGSLLLLVRFFLVRTLPLVDLLCWSVDILLLPALPFLTRLVLGRLCRVVFKRRLPA